MGTSYDHALEILINLRDCPQLFQYLIKTLDSGKLKYENEMLDRFARDLVLLFFSDFSSAEKNGVNILRQLEVMIANRFNDYVSNRSFALYGGENLMINRIIKVFINSTENRDYLNLLFGKLFHEATDFKKYLIKLHKKKSKSKSVHDLHNMPNECILQSNNPNSNTNQVPKKANDVDSTKKKPTDIIEDENMYMLCEAILNRITSKLIYMPLSMRYFFKMLEKIVILFVFFINNIE